MEMNLEELKSELKKLGKELVYYPQVTSTQDVAKKNVSSDRNDSNTIILAGQQSRGRGRFDRKWSSGKGGLWFSFPLYIEDNHDLNLALSLVIALSVATVIKKLTKLSVKLKWPNDVLVVNKKYKKVAGILVERKIDRVKNNPFIVGIGINVSNKLPRYLDPIAVSLNEFQSINRNKLLLEIIKTIDKNVILFKAKGFSVFKPEYKKLLLGLQHEIRIKTGNQTIKGFLVDINSDGTLLVKKGNGGLQTIHSAELTLR